MNNSSGAPIKAPINDKLPTPEDLKVLHESLMKLSELNIIKYRIVSAQQIGLQYHKEYADFVSKHRDMLQLKTMESIVSATLSGYPMNHEEAKLAAHTTNIILYLSMTGRQVPEPQAIIPLALAIHSMEEMVMEQILMDDEELERKK